MFFILYFMTQNEFSELTAKSISWFNDFFLDNYVLLAKSYHSLPTSTRSFSCHLTRSTMSYWNLNFTFTCFPFSVSFVFPLIVVSYVSFFFHPNTPNKVTSQSTRLRILWLYPLLKGKPSPPRKKVVSNIWH